MRRPGGEGTRCRSGANGSCEDAWTAKGQRCLQSILGPADHGVHNLLTIKFDTRRGNPNFSIPDRTQSWSSASLAVFQATGLQREREEEVCEGEEAAIYMVRDSRTIAATSTSAKYALLVDDGSRKRALGGENGAGKKDDRKRRKGRGRPVRRCQRACRCTTPLSRYTCMSESNDVVGVIGQKHPLSKC